MQAEPGLWCSYYTTQSHRGVKVSVSGEKSRRDKLQNWGVGVGELEEEYLQNQNRIQSCCYCESGFLTGLAAN